MRLKQPHTKDINSLTLKTTRDGSTIWSASNILSDTTRGECFTFIKHLFVSHDI